MNLMNFRTSNFSISEMLHSETAKSPEGVRRGLDVLQQTPTDIVLQNLKFLMIEVLQPLRNVIDSIINVNSGYRSYALNLFINGSKNSQHKKGQAADIRVRGEAWKTKELFDIIRKGFVFDQLIFYPEQNFVHVSYKNTGNNRQDVRICEIVDGVKTYPKYEVA